MNILWVVYYFSFMWGMHDNGTVTRVRTDDGGDVSC
jgi:hypothetical protein